MPPDPDRTASRRADLCVLLAADGLNALLVTGLPNVRYLTGFTGSHGAVLVAVGRAVLLTDGRYAEQAALEAPGCSVRVGSGNLAAEGARLADELGQDIVAFEQDRLTWADGERFRGALGDRAVPAAPLVERLREVKDDVELSAIRKAARQGVVAFAAVTPGLREGMTERALAIELEAALRGAGADRLGFDPIVAFGEQSAEPHHHPGDRELRRGDLVKLDFGAEVDGYRSDMTRTVVFGTASPRQRAVYEVVRAAQAAGLAALRAGVTGGEVDAACRDSITAAGFGQAFTHPTGHGVGLEIHEAPRVAAGADGRIGVRTPVTVEPGVYLPGFGGVRIEDLAVVTEDGHELLTTAPKDLLEL